MRSSHLSGGSSALRSSLLRLSAAAAGAFSRDSGFAMGCTDGGGGANAGLASGLAVGLGAGCAIGGGVGSACDNCAGAELGNGVCAGGDGVKGGLAAGGGAGLASVGAASAICFAGASRDCVRARVSASERSPSSTLPITLPISGAGFCAGAAAARGAGGGG